MNKVISLVSFKRRVTQLLTLYSTPGLAHHLFSNRNEQIQTKRTPHQNQTPTKQLQTRRPWGAVLLLGEAGERHAKEAGKVQEKQVWTLWEVFCFSDQIVPAHWPRLLLPCPLPLHFDIKSSKGCWGTGLWEALQEPGGLSTVWSQKTNFGSEFFRICALTSKSTVSTNFFSIRPFFRKKGAIFTPLRVEGKKFLDKW